jgi:hypothetical protein
VLRREGDQVVLDGHADHCCVLTLGNSAVTRLFDVLGSGWGERCDHGDNQPTGIESCPYCGGTSSVQQITGTPPKVQGWLWGCAAWTGGSRW